MWPNKAEEIRSWLRTDILLWVSFAFIHVSPAIASVGLVGYVLQLMLLGVRVELNAAQKLAGWGIFAVLLWNVLSLIDSVTLGWITLGVFDSGEVGLNVAMSKVLLKLPFLLICGLMASGKRLNTIFYARWPLAILPLIWISVSSVIHYLQHRGFYDQMVLESKPIPLYSKVYHIEFSVILGAAVLFLFRGLLLDWIAASYKKMAWMATATLVLCMHILGTRTGLVLLYIGGSLMWFERYYRTPKFFLRLGALSLLLLAMLLTIPSTRNRLVNTLQDFNATQSGGDVTHQSFGQRWIAWKTAVHLLKSDGNSIFMGSGMGVDENLRRGYEKLDVPLAERHRIGVHNQWFETALQSGCLSALGLLVFGFFLFQKDRSNSNFNGNSIWLALIAAMMFESVLERQAGLLVVIVAFQLLMGEKIWQNSKIKNEDTLIN